VIENYLVLRRILPLVRPDDVDAWLLEVDLVLFGVEPALWLERFNERPIVEWFAFFYFSYFWICLAYMVVGLWLLRSRRAASEYAMGTVLVFGVGQLGYMAVPGHGPVTFLADRFQGPIDGGFFWSCVTATVTAGSAMKDIFPSLHTAVPVWLTLFAWRLGHVHRAFRLAAIVTGFFAANIVASTMLLRWHYAVDVLAGLALAFATAGLAPALVRWEAAFRERHRLRGAWDFG
jgi:hypothetical protein